MSTVATGTHTIELVLAHAATLGRMVNSAFQVKATHWGTVEIMVHEESGRDLPATLGLEHIAREDHVDITNGKVFREWMGKTSSAFGTFETRVTVVEPGRYLGHRFEADNYDNGPECIHCHTFANHAAPDEACRVRDAKALAAEIPADCDAASLS